MNKAIVSLVGAQTLPNVYFMKNNLDADKFLFVTTIEMEKRGIISNMTDALGISENKIERIVVDSRYPYKIIESLKASPLDFSSYYNYVNITGGTKMMSLAAYAFFSKMKNNCSIYYIPEGEERFLPMYPASAKKLGEMEFLTLEEYMASYGACIERVNQPYKSLETADIYFKNANFNMYNDRDNINFKQKEELRCLLNELAFDYDSLNGSDRRYLFGGWLEEYVFLSLLESGKLQRHNIRLGAKIRKKDQKNERLNEFDVVFLHRNTLVVVECKSGFVNSNKNLKEALYKQRAVLVDLGITVKPYLFVTKKATGTDKKHAATLGISIVDIDGLKNGILSNFENLFK
jgi:hypothetical protein